MRADSMRPHASGPRTITTPTPALEPTARSDSDAYGVAKCAGPTHAPPYPPTRSAWAVRCGPAGNVDQWGAPVDLHDPGVLDRARDGDETRARVLDEAAGPERIGA